MKTAPRIFILDANVFIEAHKRHYAFTLCPGFWQALLHFHRAGQIFSVDRVRDEILVGDELGKWARTTAPKGFFAKCDLPEVGTRFGEMMQWVEDEQFTTAATEEFATVADGWLAAYAKHANATLEQYSPTARKKVLIPNVCKEFNIPYVNPFSMLRELEVKFTWEP